MATRLRVEQIEPVGDLQSVNNLSDLASATEALLNLGILSANISTSGGTLTIRSSNGFSSITRTSAGLVVFNLATAAPNTNYQVFVTKENSALNNDVFMSDQVSQRTTSSFRVALGENNALADSPNANIMVII